MKPQFRILLAEDNENDIELTLEAFNQHGLQDAVDVCRDGTLALDYLYCRGAYSQRIAENPILILLDNKMPKLTGIDVLKTIKQDENLRNIPVIMLTSSDIGKDIIESYNLGVNAYVVKPVDFEEFIETVKTLGLFWITLNKVPR
ncbi:MAG TPA: response regulator [Bacteroidales bacterium]|nr:response regulator [Bacteroidales bacterium]